MILSITSKPLLAVKSHSQSYMALSTEGINFTGVNLLDDPNQVGAVGEIAVKEVC